MEVVAVVGAHATLTARAPLGAEQVVTVVQVLLLSLLHEHNLRPLHQQGLARWMEIPIRMAPALHIMSLPMLWKMLQPKASAMVSNCFSVCLPCHYATVS